MIMDDRTKTLFGIIIVLYILYFSTKAQKTELAPLCSHPSSQRITILETFPAPEYLFEWYVRPSQPVLFKSVLENIHYPAYTKWTDQYLKDKYGDLYVETEEPKLGYRNADNVKTRLMKDVLEDYQKSDIYMIQRVLKPMEDDVLVPSCLHCGGFQDVINKVYIWLSSGGTKGVLHYDDMDNMNCLLDGSKDLKLISWKYKERVEADQFNSDIGFSFANVTHLDLEQFPALRDIPWTEVHMDKGDCLFIPIGWYHQVNSDGARNLAINIWFRRLLWFNQSDCDDSHSSRDTLSDYSEVTTLHIFRLDLLRPFKHLSQLTIENLALLTEDGNMDTAAEILKFLDIDGDEIASWEEMMSFDMTKFLQKFA